MGGVLVKTCKFNEVHWKRLWSLYFLKIKEVFLHLDVLQINDCAYIRIKKFHYNSDSTISK